MLESRRKILIYVIIFWTFFFLYPKYDGVTVTIEPFSYIDVYENSSTGLRTLEIKTFPQESVISTGFTIQYNLCARSIVGSKKHTLDVVSVVKTDNVYVLGAIARQREIIPDAITCAVTKVGEKWEPWFKFMIRDRSEIPPFTEIHGLSAKAIKYEKKPRSRLSALITAFCCTVIIHLFFTTFRKIFLNRDW